MPELDLPVLVVIELVGPQHLRQIGPGRAERLVRPQFRLLGDVLKRHLGRFQPRAHPPGQRDRHAGQQPDP